MAENSFGKFVGCWAKRLSINEAKYVVLQPENVLKLLKTTPCIDVVGKAACNFPGHGATRNLDLEGGVVKDGDGNWGTVNARGGVPSSVGIRVCDIIGPFVVRPFGKSTLSTISMSPNPFRLEVGKVRPVSCRDDNISVNGIVDGMEVVVVLYVVDPFDKGLIIACMECWDCWRASNEVV